MELFIISLSLLVILVWLIISYNNLVRDQNRVQAGWSDIDVQLTRRHELIPNLVATTKQYADYEQAVLQSVTELRSQSKALQETNPETITKKSAIEQQLAKQVTQIMALVESYPDLKADQQFTQLQQELVDIENHLQYARRYYNGAVRNLNTRIESFPDLVVARLFNFKSAEFFQLETEQVAKPVQVDL